MSYAARGVTIRVGEATLLARAWLELRPGELLAVVGPNGAGKSTLVRALAGDARPSTGEVTLDGRPLSAWAGGELALRRAVVAGEPSVAFGFTVEEVVLLGRLPHHGGRPAASDRILARALLEAVDAAHLAGRRYATLSSGERQRVGLARAIAQVAAPAGPGRDGGPVAADGAGPRDGAGGRPSRYLLLDEPAANLDPAHQHAAMRLLRAQARDDVGVLVVLHDLQLVAAYCDRVSVLHAGRIIEAGSPPAVLRPDLLERVFGIPILVLPHPHAAYSLIVADPPPER